MTTAWIGLGANLGDPSAMLAAAVRAIDALDQIRIAAVSPAYCTAPWGKTDQPEFLNAAARLETELGPHQLLDRLLAIETELGRRRDANQWGPRVIDLDLLVYGEERISDDSLSLPHPRLSERAFVLVPLHDLAPKLVVPGVGRVDELLAALDDRQLDAVRPAPPLPLTQPESSEEEP